MQCCKDNDSINESNDYVNLAVLTSIGDRAEQQDCFGYFFNETGGIIVVCDGMGGSAGGKQASSAATASILDFCENVGNNVNFDMLLPDAIVHANTAVCDIGISDPEYSSAGSTAVAIMISSGLLYWASVGDSRAYIIRNGQIIQITKDQNYRTVLNEQLALGRISKEKYEESLPKADALISFLGMNRIELIDYSKKGLPLRKGDLILIMTDGLFKLVSDNEMLHVISRSNCIADALRELAKEADQIAENRSIKRDNMTVALVEIK